MNNEEIKKALLNKLYFYGGVWHAKNGDKEYESADFTKAWLFAAGYGCDQAAELRYLMQKKNSKKGKSVAVSHK